MKASTGVSQVLNKCLIARLRPARDVVIAGAENIPLRLLRQPTGSHTIGHFWTDSVRQWNVLVKMFRIAVVQGLTTNHPTTAWKFLPMDPRTIHPIIHSRSAHSCNLLYGMYREELGFFLTVLAEKNRHERTPICTEDCDPIEFQAYSQLLK
jgi:hypothetical protein